MKKRIFTLTMAVIMAASLMACGAAKEEPKQEEKIEQEEKKAAQESSKESEEAKEEIEKEKPAFEEATVRVAYMPNLGSASSLFTAIEQGYFEKVGLNVETFEFQGGPAEIAAMGSGDIDISQIGHGAHKLCIAGQAKVFEMDQNSLADAVVANKSKGIEKIEDLKGKKVAVQSGTSSEIILQLALEEANMSEDDIDKIEMDANGMVTAMVAGQIDACATWSPSTVSIEKGLGDNYLVLADNSDYLEKASFPGSFITTSKYAEENPDILVRFAAAIMMAKDYRPEHIDEIAKLLAVKLDVPEDIMLAATGEGDWAGAKKAMKDNDTIKTYYEAQQNVFLNTGAIEKEVPVEDYIMFDVMTKATDLYNELK